LELTSAFCTRKSYTFSLTGRRVMTPI